MKAKENIILVGGGGHCKSCIDVIEHEGKYNIAGIIDLPSLKGTKVLGYEVIGNDHDLRRFAKNGYSFLVTLGHMGNVSRRKAIFEELEAYNANLPVVISPTAYVSKHSNIGEGTIVMHEAIINVDVKVGKNVILNTGCLIEHEASVGNHTHISTRAVINGQCFIGNNTFIGSNSTVKNNVEIAENIIIGANSSVLKTIHDSGTYVGASLRKIK